MQENSRWIATDLRLKWLGICDYQPIYEKMLNFTKNRDADSCDELWLLEHNPVFTQGNTGKDEHILTRSDIPIIKTDRGGQVTYHGPGQLVGYVLIDLKRKVSAKPSIRKFVEGLELSIIACLDDYGIKSYAKTDAPGVYVNHLGEEHKICSLGLKLIKGCSFHGIALNVNPDLSPFLQINPCGYAGLKMCSIQSLLTANNNNIKFDQKNVLDNLFDTSFVRTKNLTKISENTVKSVAVTDLNTHTVGKNFAKHFSEIFNCNLI